ncbi:MAG: DNA-processing protein DprA, partial [Gemmatimonadaceae bacterium]
MSAETIQSLSRSERRAILALSLVPDVGAVTHRQLLERFRSASRAIDATMDSARARAACAAADDISAATEQAGLELTVVGDPPYPASLHHLHDPPPVLWSRGDWSALTDPVVAIVGTRRATSYGQRVTREIAAALARQGACIVSGMALGIDATAHRAALDAGGRTIAVLGTGADISYPRANTALHREIGQRGLLLAELPPGAKSDPGSFPRRNRIIAALARLTIVVEAPELSGALITSGVALELGRDVAAVPGPIDAPQSVGTNRLLRDGAHVLTSAADALALVGLTPPARIEPELHGEGEVRVWRALENGPSSLDELCSRTAMPVAECLTSVTALELRGIVECAITG